MVIEISDSGDLTNSSGKQKRLTKTQNFLRGHNKGHTKKYINDNILER